MARRDPNAHVFDDVRRILRADWDPIGGAPSDEYDTYAARAYSMLVQGSDEASIASYLDAAWAQFMGEEASQVSAATPTERSHAAAAKIMSLKEQLV